MKYFSYHLVVLIIFRDYFKGYLISIAKSIFCYKKIRHVRLIYNLLKYYTIKIRQPWNNCSICDNWWRITTIHIMYHRPRYFRWHYHFFEGMNISSKDKLLILLIQIHSFVLTIAVSWYMISIILFVWMIWKWTICSRRISRG